MTYLVVKHNIMKSVIWRLNANCLYCSRLQQVGNISYNVKMDIDTLVTHREGTGSKIEAEKAVK